MVTLLLRALLAVGRLLTALGSRGEAAEAPATSLDDHWMSVEQVVSDDHHPQDFHDTDCLEGFTPEETAVLRANYEAWCDDERIQLGWAFEDIARRENFAGLIRRAIAEHEAQTGADQ